MGGCVSVEGAYHKLMGSNLKTYNLPRVEITVASEKPLHSLSENLVVPLYLVTVGDHYDILLDFGGMECESSEKTVFGDKVRALLTAENSEKVRNEKICVAPLERSFTTSLPQMTLKNIIFVALGTDPSFVRDKFGETLQKLFSKVEELELKSLTIPRLLREGTSHTEMAVHLAKETVRFYCRKHEEETAAAESKKDDQEPGVLPSLMKKMGLKDEKKLTRLFFCSDNPSLDLEITKAFDETLKKQSAGGVQKQLQPPNKPKNVLGEVPVDGK